MESKIAAAARRVVAGTAGVGLMLAMAACGGAPSPPGLGAGSPSQGLTSPGAGPGSSCEVATGAAGSPVVEPAAPVEPALRAELLALRDADQAERTGEVAGSNDATRAGRLREIIGQYGWPTRTLVGADGASAAWLIAQHSDFDVQFQQEALGLMCAALATGEADPVDVAYLTDRVAVNLDRPQRYGTQLGGCEDGRAVPRPIADEEAVDERRRQVGLEPLADYLSGFDPGCAGPDQD